VQGAIIVNQDVTARVRVETALRESEERMKAVFRAAPTGIGVTCDRVLLDVNTRICEMTGYARDELIGRSARFLYPSQEDFDHVGTEKYRQIAERGTGTVETRWLTKDGGIIDILLSSTPIDMTDMSVGVVFTALDITERKLVERQNRSLLAEKDILLKEVHHRIKNNMSTIASLLALQARGLSSEQAVAALTDARSRVNTMMEIYEKLYRSPDYRSIRAADYLGRLIEGIRLTYSTGTSIRIEKRIDDMTLDSRVLFPAGMIVNELLTNALRHAFPDGRNGEIEVGLVRAGGEIELTVSDNGEGIPPHVEVDNARGFGLVLVSTLAEQLGGALELERGNGTSWTLRFPG
nr:PAS domain S-box protein [Spirochaetota bacterium]